MTDKELLEKAAKAAGIKIDKSPTNGGGSGNTGFNLNGDAVLDWHNGVTWNPLRNDGDAFRLSVKLGISISHIKTPPAVCVKFVLFGAIELFTEVFHEESLREKATRLAIVRAASYLADYQDAG